MGMPIPIIIDSDSESSPQRKRRRGGSASDSPPGSPHGSNPQSPHLTAPPRRPSAEEGIPRSSGLRRLIAAADRTERDFMRRALRAEFQLTEGDDETPEDTDRSEEDSPNGDSSTLSLDSPHPVHLDSPPFRLPVPRYRMLPTFNAPADSHRRMQNNRYYARLARSGALRRLPSSAMYSGAVQPNVASPPTAPSRTRMYGVSTDRPGPGSSLPRARRRDSFRFTRPPAPFGADVDMGAGVRRRSARSISELGVDEGGPHLRPLTYSQIFQSEDPESLLRGASRTSGSVPHDIIRSRRARRTSRLTGLNREAVRAVEEHYRNAGRNGVRPRGRLDMVQTYVGPSNTQHGDIPPISLVFVDESGGPDVGDWWELGAWRSGVVLTGRDVFQMLMDVLTECARIARCKISSLLVCDGLEDMEGVQQGIQLLKNLELPSHRRTHGQADRRRRELVVQRALAHAEYHGYGESRAGADVAMQEGGNGPAEGLFSGAFVHPMTGDSINIMLE